MTINVDAYSQSLERPDLVLGGVTYPGKVPSHPVAQRLLTKFAAFDEASIDDQMGIIAEICEVAGWPFDKVAALERPILFQVINDFFGCLRVRRLSVDGTASNGSTPS